MRRAGRDRFVRAIRLDRASVPSFDVYPFCLPAVRHLAELRLDKPVTYLVGENGSGKSTLLEAIAVSFGFNAEGGSRNFRFGTRDSHSALHEHLILEKGRRPCTGYFFRAESWFNVATNIEDTDRENDQYRGSGPPIIGSYGGRPLHEQSHGESFFALFLERFGGGGLYLLDEPEAALSPSRQMGVLTRIHDLVRAGSQFVIATHSPILMAYPDATILVLTENGIRPTPWHETEHYTVTKHFLDAPDVMLRELLADEDAASGRDETG